MMDGLFEIGPAVRPFSQRRAPEHFFPLPGTLPHSFVKNREDGLRREHPDDS